MADGAPKGLHPLHSIGSGGSQDAAQVAAVFLAGASAALAFEVPGAYKPDHFLSQMLVLLAQEAGLVGFQR